MKTLGLIGGLSWESTTHYYQRLNQLVAARLGGLHSAKLLLHSVDFDEVQVLQHAGKWPELGRMFAAIARNLERGGAEGLIICANTMHILADEVRGAVSLPLISVIDAVAEEAARQKLGTLALLGTRFTMEKPFYAAGLAAKGLQVKVPEQTERMELHRIIYDELCRGIVRPESKEIFYKVVDRLTVAGARAAILGCTEFSLFADTSRSPVPLLDSTELHAQAVAEWMLG